MKKVQVAKEKVRNAFSALNKTVHYNEQSRLGKP